MKVPPFPSSLARMNGAWLLSKLDSYCGSSGAAKVAGRSTITVEERANAEKLRRFILSNEHCFSAEHPPRRGRESENEMGHITGSAWLLSPDRSKVLLTHHRKLDKWLQLGGHSDGCANVLETALREAREESGIWDLRALSEEIFDLDIHEIPARGAPAMPAHLHYDVRFLLISESSERFTTTAESKELRWVTMDELTRFSQERSVLRMLEKWRAFTCRATA